MDNGGITNNVLDNISITKAEELLEEIFEQ